MIASRVAPSARSNPSSVSACSRSLGVSRTKLRRSEGRRRMGLERGRPGGVRVRLVSPSVGDTCRMRASLVIGSDTADAP